MATKCMQNPFLVPQHPLGSPVPQQLPSGSSGLCCTFPPVECKFCQQEPGESIWIPPKIVQKCYTFDSWWPCIWVGHQDTVPWQNIGVWVGSGKNGGGRKGIEIFWAGHGEHGDRRQDQSHSEMDKSYAFPLLHTSVHCIYTLWSCTSWHRTEESHRNNGSFPIVNLSSFTPRRSLQPHSPWHGYISGCVSDKPGLGCNSYNNTSKTGS